MLRAVANPPEDDFAALLAEYDQPGPRKLSVGDMVEGQVVSIGAEAVFVSLGGKSEGMLELDQVSDSDGKLTVAVGDTVEARVVDTGRTSGCVLLRRTVGKGPQAAEELVQAHAHGLPVEGLVVATNKGGYDVTIAGVRAFCPVSQIELRFVEDPEVHVGARYSFRITKLEQGRSRIDMVVSRRALLEEEAAIAAEETRAKLHEGAVLSGVVTTLKPYGAFVDLGGLEGMIHISELGHSRVGDPSEVVAPGQRVQVKVLRIEGAKGDKKREKIGLSLKALESDPWNDATARLTEGQTLRGVVVRTQPFGAFVEIAPGVEGLVHISELGAGRRINHPREVVREGQEVEVRVLSVELDKKRISLSMTPSDELSAEDMRAPAAAAAVQPSRSLGTLGDLLTKSMKK